MQDEEMDDMIKDAAKQHYPTYDDKAWGKMEHLLDKHLPQKKDKKRYLLFLLLFVLIGTGGFFAIIHSKKSQSPASAAIVQNKPSNNMAISSIASNSQNNTLNTSNDNSITKQTASTVKTPATSPGSSIQTQALVTKNNQAKNDQIILKRKSRFKNQSVNADIASDDISQPDKKQTGSIKKASIINTISSDEMVNNEETTLADSSITKTNNIQPVATSSTINETKDSSFKAAAASTTVSVLKTSDKKDKKTFADKFAFTVSFGPGLSYVGLDDFGKTTIAYGAGVSYAVSKRVFLRTGFYASSKIYSANGSDYHPPKWFATYYPNLQKVDANCKVYEIPLNISYAFAQKKNHNWFVSTGLSSYLMKKEDYGYFYLDNNGQQQFKTSNIDNQNQHFFSILTFSGGYQYKINELFSFMVEPYIEIPLNGIGFGKIKLNSSGLLLTAVIKPFAGKK